MDFEVTFEELVQKPFSVPQNEENRFVLKGDRIESTVALKFMLGEFEAAVNAGEGPEGRRRLGQGLHTLEDFYAHSNYAELALRRVGHVDVFPWTLWNTIDGRPALVTGKFGGADSAASLLLVVAEKLQEASQCSLRPEDHSALLNLVPILIRELLARSGGLFGDEAAIRRTWDRYAPGAILLAQQLSEASWGRRIGAPFRRIGEVGSYAYCLASAQAAKFSAAILAGWADIIAQVAMGHEVEFDGTTAGAVRAAGNSIGTVQTRRNNRPKIPSHTQLAKDHDDHPLHDLAARMARDAVANVFTVTRAAWRGRATGAQVGEVAASYFVHPDFVAHGSNAWTSLELASGERFSRAEMRRLTNPRWAAQVRHRHWRVMRRRAAVILDVVLPDGTENFVRLLHDAWRRQQ